MFEAFIIRDWIFILAIAMLNALFMAVAVYIGSNGGKRILDRYLTTLNDRERNMGKTKEEIKDADLQELAEMVKK